jgi:hypothetical protein
VADKILQHKQMQGPASGSWRAGAKVLLLLQIVAQSHMACVLVAAGLIAAALFLPSSVVSPVLLGVAGLLLSVAIVNMP